MLGDHYRDVWLTPVQIPIIDLDSAKQGLTILDKVVACRPTHSNSKRRTEGSTHFGQYKKIHHPPYHFHYNIALLMMSYRIKFPLLIPMAHSHFHHWEMPPVFTTPTRSSFISPIRQSWESIRKTTAVSWPCSSRMLTKTGLAMKTLVGRRKPSVLHQ